MLAIVTTHPIQYQVPLWQALARDGRVPFEVWYLTDHGTRPSLDVEFDKTFSWDIDTLSGYPHRFLATADGASPGTPWKCRLRERMRDRLRETGAKALWIQGWQVLAYWQAVREAKAAGVDVWLRGESNDLAPTPQWKRLAKRLILGQLFARVDRFFYIGTANKRLYRSFGISEKRLVPALYFVDNERFARQAAEVRPRRAELRRQWGIAENAYCVLFCGKFIPKKRPADLIRAAQLLEGSRRSHVHLLFVGSGELGRALRESCNVVYDAELMGGASSRPGLPQASFTGFLNQTEISRAYVVADCLVLPSDHGETWGLVVNEALASGLPCLVSDACGCAEDLAGSKCSFPMGSINALADKLARFHSAGPTAAALRLPSIDDSIGAIAKIYSDIGT